MNILTHKTYILASSSKSRKFILKNCGLKIKQVKPDCDEEVIKKRIKRVLKPVNIAKTLSYEKARSLSIKKEYYKDYVIGCDTLVYLDKRVFDKAKNMNEARNKLIKLSGKTHKIVSGLTICREGKKIWQTSETTTVKIRKLKLSQIEQYLKKTGKQILNSVGCYQIEALGPSIIENIKGDFFNVLGLPLFKLLRYVSKIK